MFGMISSVSALSVLAAGWFVVGGLLALAWLFVIFKWELGRTRAANVLNLSRRERFQSFWIPPHSWRFTKRIRAHFRLDEAWSVVFYLCLWVLIPLGFAENDFDVSNAEDWGVVLFFLIPMILLAIRAYRNKCLSKFFLPTFSLRLPTSLEGSQRDDTFSPPTRIEVVQASSRLFIFICIWLTLAVFLRMLFLGLGSRSWLVVG